MSSDLGKVAYPPRSLASQRGIPTVVTNPATAHTSAVVCNFKKNVNLNILRVKIKKKEYKNDC